MAPAVAEIDTWFNEYGHPADARVMGSRSRARLFRDSGHESLARIEDLHVGCAKEMLQRLASQYPHIFELLMEHDRHQ